VSLYVNNFIVFTTNPSLILKG